MRKPPVIPAALLAATFALALPGLTEARSKGKTTERSVSSASRGKAAVRKAGSKSARAKKTSARAGRRAAARRAAARRAAARSTPRRSAPHLDRSVSVISAVEIREVHGPFLPREVHDYPQLPCPAIGEVVVAELHDPDPIPYETPEPDIAASTVLPPRLARLARRFGSLLRPKSAAAKVKPQDVDLAELLAGGLQVPVEGIDAGKLRDSFLEARGKHARHLAIDIGAPRGTPIVATADGEILKLTREARGGISIYQKDPSGRFLFFYCHLSRYAEGLEAGQSVARGEVIGYVGSTGRVIGGPHLHFSITRLPEDDDNFREGLAINPYLLFLAGVP